MNPPCRRCLLEDLSRQAFANIYEYIDSIPAAEKAPPKVYRQRLDSCRQCSNLMNGMCSLCGCFVEVRAAKRINACPDTPSAWGRIPSA